MSAAVVLAVFVTAAVVEPRQQPRALEGGVVVQPQTLSQIVARCSGEYIFPNAGKNMGNTDENNEPLRNAWTVLGVVDSDLPRDPQGINEGIYYSYTAPELPAVRTGLDEGLVVVWYSPDLSQESVTSLGGLVTRVMDRTGQPISMVPLPERLSDVVDFRVGVSERGRFVGCAIPSIDALNEFIDSR